MALTSSSQAKKEELCDEHNNNSRPHVSHLLFHHGLEFRPVASLLAQDERLGDVSGPLDLAGCDQHLRNNTHKTKRNLNPTSDVLELLHSPVASC